MSFQLSDLWRWDGSVGRGVYAGVGLVGFALKHNLDRLVAWGVFHRPWGLFNYLSPGPDSVRGIDHQHMVFLGTLVALALPFIWTGVCLTARRLRSTHLPIWLLIFFFIPLINLIFFILLALLPPRSEEGEQKTPRNFMLDRLIPDHPLGAALMAQLLVVPAALMAVFLSVTGLGRYGWGLFVGLPFSMGLGAVLLFGYHRQRTLLACLGVACLSVALLGAALFALAMEGVVCLMMAAPLGLILACLGGLLGYSIQRRPNLSPGGGLNRSGEATTSLIGLVISLPALMGAESLANLEAPVYSVTSSVIIQAPPEKVWPKVIQFNRMPPPTEFIFKMGVAYPIQARLEGKGVGAIRRCVFSTGPFVEPITCWDEPRRLAFSVTSNPDPLQEWTPYRELHPPHSNGYMVSQGGEFRLVPLEGGRTRLEGTTWYRHGLWPGPYWKWWSDGIIHTIHLRVLHFIQDEAESGSSQPNRGQDGDSQHE